MKHRIFIAISIPEEIKHKLVEVEKNFKNLSLRFVKPENLHLTLVFNEWSDEFSIEKMKKIMEELTKRHQSFILRIEKITLGPDFKRPRMVWAVGEKSLELENLWKDLREKLKENNIPFDDKYPLKVHLTLARARGRELFGRKIDKIINIAFPVKEIALIESHLKPEGAEYNILESFHFPK